jgi:hypothetical protein
MAVSPEIFEIAFLFGTGAIALWIDARFPSLAPADLRRALIRTGAALVGSQVLFMPAFNSVVARGDVLLAIFALAFPCLGCVLLSTIWSIRQLQASMRGAR